MDFKQKAEEKKMSMSKNIARLAVTAGLTAALSFGGVMAPATMAFAAVTPTVAESGNVTIKEDTYKDTTFKGIQIFKATVTQDYDGSVWSGDKTLSDIDWANNSVMNAVTTAFDNVDTSSKPTDLPTDKSAQAWVNFINSHRTEVAGNNVNAGSVLDMIAKSLESQAWTDAMSGTTGTFEGIDAGYWLFETKSVGATTGADGNKDAYTSPIFAVVGGEDVKVEPKKNVPNVTKAVRDDATGSSFGDFTNPNKAADSGMDQFIDYQLTGTVASNINTYGEYYYEFKDELPGTMSAELIDGTEKPKVTVKINGDEVTSGYDATYENNVLKVVFTNLKACMCSSGSVTFNAETKVTVEYKAKLDSSKIFEDGVMKPVFHGLVGIPQKNKVTLTYSNNPHTTEHGTTVEHPAYDYTYGIDVTKVGSDDVSKGLEGVVFTLQEQGDTDLYIMANGVKTTDEGKAKLTTDADGRINVVGLDEGTYILKEVTPAPGYNNSAANGVTFTIKRDLNQTGDDVTPSVNSAIKANPGLVKDNAATASTGKLSFTIVDQKGSGLPLTGLNGVTFTWIAGGAVLCIGVAHLIRSRKQAEESEQE